MENKIKKLENGMILCMDYDDIEACLDECGAGPFLGNVMACAVILPKRFDSDMYLQIKDSKKVSKKKRPKLAEYIKNICLDWAIGTASVKEIAEHNILNCRIMAMHRAIDKLKVKPNSLLIDGNKFKPYMDCKADIIPHTCIIKGDAKILGIAAASIVCKDTHTQYIKQLCKDNPELVKYDILNNSGYGTKKHIEAIKKYNITKFHRKLFCRKYIPKTQENLIIKDNIFENYFNKN